jgi:hypothetical protein
MRLAYQTRPGTVKNKKRPYKATTNVQRQQQSSMTAIGPAIASAWKAVEKPCAEAEAGPELRPGWRPLFIASDHWHSKSKPWSGSDRRIKDRWRTMANWCSVSLGTMSAFDQIVKLSFGHVILDPGTVSTYLT